MTRDEATPDLDLTPCFVPRCDLLKLMDMATKFCGDHPKCDTPESLARTSAFLSGEKALAGAPVSLAAYRAKRSKA